MKIYKTDNHYLPASAPGYAMALARCAGASAGASMAIEAMAALADGRLARAAGRGRGGRGG